MQEDKIVYSEFERVDPERTVGDENFANGEIIFKKFMSTSSYINLYRSYFRLTLQVSDDMSNNNVAPTFLAAETIFKSMYYKINNVVVSEIGNHVGQCAAIRNRLGLSKCRRDSLEKDMNFGNVEFSERQKTVEETDLGNQILEGIKPGDQTSTIGSVQNPQSLTAEQFGLSIDNLITIEFKDGESYIATIDQGAGDVIPDLTDISSPGDSFSLLNAATDNIEQYFIVGVQPNLWELALTSNANTANDVVTQAIGLSFSYYRLSATSNQSNILVGNNTQFTQDFNESDVIRFEDTFEEYIVISVESDTILRVSPNPPRYIFPTVNWLRIRRINQNRNHVLIDCIFKPSLGIFSLDEFILGHDLSISLFPHSDPLWQKYFVQSKNGNVEPGDDTYSIRIVNLVFYPYIGYVDKSVASADRTYSFIETRCQTQNITSSSMIDRTFVIDNRTKAITLALQDSSTQSGNNQFPTTLFKCGENIDSIPIELDLQNYSILYDKYQWPKPQHDLQYDNTQDRIAQAYYENLMYANTYLDYQCLETYEEWKKLGPYYHYNIPLRENQSNPKLSIRTSFRSIFDQNRPNILLFDHFERDFKLIARNGRVVEVIPAEHGQ